MVVSLFGWPTVTRAVVGPVLVGGLIMGLLSGCAAPASGIGGTDPAAGGFAVTGDVDGVGGAGRPATGGFTGLGGPASAGLPGGLPWAGRTGQEPSISAPARVPSPAPIPPPAVPDVPRRSADLAGLAGPVSAPVRVRVPALGIDMPIEAVGLAEDAAMALPANPAVAAWYRYGAGPASPAGATVVAAHVDSLVYDIGPFALLADAPAGTEIVLETADGGAHRYTVASVDSVEKPAVPWASVFDRSGQPRLTLVTCGGEFDYDARRYLSNVIVTAVPAP
ncbi:sortase [Cryobacterium sp. LW097]|uniref:class F sortase n=1 Tax=unclassified Cryobacterium TaxID=2649013 RepID=UPI000B4C92F4|nr:MULTISPECIES: class F sortase [unclassified Cryobacterium]ASD21124.1 sortase [Cryobacterium sp. LW097]TFC56514.1 class F sortase [Cryobacterium sp. TMB1-7]TFC85363.1 class F sortase [Cryobacterium sp. TMT4-31]